MTMASPSSYRNVTCLTIGLGLWALLGCSTDRSDGIEVVAAKSNAVFSTDDPTTVTPGSGAPLPSASCPGRKLPDQCGTWQGVELTASHRHFPHREVDDERCVCAPIEFQVPAALPVISGNAGVFKAELSFRKTNGRTVECSYRGNRRLGHSFKWTGGDAYELERCSDGSRAGATLQADWFELALQGSDPLAGPTEVKLRLGEPDVVDGVVQEEVIHATDSRIAGAALYVPRGSAPDGQTFSVSVVPQVAVGSIIANGGDGFKTTGYVVDVHADGVDNFVFTDVPGAECPRIVLPYAANQVPEGSEERLRARQVTSLAGIPGGGQVLAPTGPLTVDPVNRTVSFCVEHLSFYVSGTDQSDANLSSAYILEVPGTSCSSDGECGGNKCFTAGGALGMRCFTDAQSTTLTLRPSTDYKLRLVFENEGASWAANAVRVVSSTARDVLMAPLYPSPWFPSDSVAFERLLPAVASDTFTPAILIDVESPAEERSSSQYPYGGALNLCLRTNPAPAPPATGFFGQCFSWDPGNSTANSGHTPAQLYEICDRYDNDGDGDVNEGFTPAFGTLCSNGELGVCNRTDLVVCNDESSTRCDAPSGASSATIEICGNGIDEDCNGSDLACPVGVGVCANGDARRDDFQTEPNSVGNWDWNCDGNVEAKESVYSVPNHQVCDDGICYDPVADPYRYCDYMRPYEACNSRETLYYFDDPGPLDQQCGKVRHELFCAFSFGEFICQPRDRAHEQYWPTVYQDCR